MSETGRGMNNGVYYSSLAKRLEALEVEYADLTDGEALVAETTMGVVRWAFADGGTANTLERAVTSAEALVRFVKNQKTRGIKEYQEGR